MITVSVSRIDADVVAPGPVLVSVIPGQGPKGDPGTGGATYLHTQSSPASTWTVNHNLGVAAPVVAVFSVGGVELDAQIVLTSPNQCVISFNQPTAGTARVTD